MKTLSAKHTSIIFALGLSLTAASQCLAQVEPQTVSGNHELLTDAKEVVKKCVVELVKAPKESAEDISAGAQVVGFESTCPELKLLSQHRAQINIDGEWYLAEVSDSPHSDGGDLDNMTLKNQSGQVVAERTDVAAYDMVVLALAGGNAKLRQKLVP